MPRIIVGHDGSEGADRAVELVAALKFPPDTPVDVVTAMPDIRAMRSAWGRLILGPPGPIEQQLAAQAARELEVVAERAREAGLQAATTVVVGRPARALVAEAERSGATLLAVGSRGLGRIRSSVMGSVSAELVHTASCPVLVARSGSIKRVVLATDGSDQALCAERYLANLPIARDVPVSIVTVADPLPVSIVTVAVPLPVSLLWTSPDRDAAAEAVASHARIAREQHEAVASAAAERLAAQGINAQVEVRLGDRAFEVVRATRRHDLVVLGWDDRSESAPAFGAVLHKVLYGSAASVLVVR